MVTIYIDGQQHSVEDGQNVLQACLSLGLNLPYFCWHPALHSVGACRLCAVKQFKDEHDKVGKIVMGCMTPVAKDMRISIEDPEARQFRAAVIEFLMVNHPHDCPVCDEGGECHLQDMTYMTGHDYRNYRFLKRTHRNQNLGSLVNHEMNRCIACYRCVRYYRDYAGGRDLDVFGAHDNVYFGRAEDGVLESEFSGNLVEVCPTGVFTDKTLGRHYTRKWDLQTAPSICVHCSVGCNTIPGERYGLLRRIRNRYNYDVNGYFLCDRGRYGYEFVNSSNRILLPEIEGQVVSGDDALRRITEMLVEPSKIIGIGSARASLESNFALRALVGPECFFQGVSARTSQLNTMAVQLMRRHPEKVASLKDVAESDAVLILGEDPTNSAPMVALALRQASREKPKEQAKKLKIPEWHAAAVLQVIQDQHGPFFIASPAATKLDEVATQTCRVAPDDIARLGFAVANLLDASSPGVPDLSKELLELARTIADSLRQARQPLVVCGTGGGVPEILHAAANILAALGAKARVCVTFSECNSVGLTLMGGGELVRAFDSVQRGAAETVIILENDLYRQAEEKTVTEFLNRAKHVIVLDHITHATTQKAEIVLPVGTFAESCGTFVNNESRAQRFYEVFVPSGHEICSAWRWLGEMRGAGWAGLDNILSELTQVLPVFKEVANAAPPAGFRIAGEKIPRQPHRYSGRTSMHANVSVHESEPPPDHDSPLAYSMEGFDGIPPSPLIPRFWQPGWNSIQSLNKFQQEVAGPLKGGVSGRRLITGTPQNGGQFFDGVPAPFTPRKGEWLLVPLHHIFGSDELSMLAPGIAELAPKPYVAVNPVDAAGLGIADGGLITVSAGTTVLTLPAKLIPSLPPGLAGFPVGLPEVGHLPLPTWAKLTRERRG